MGIFNSTIFAHLQDKKLFEKNQDFHTAMQIIYCLHEEMETQSAEQKAKTEQLMQSFQEREQVLEAKLRRKDEIIAGLNEKVAVTQV